MQLEATRALHVADKVSCQIAERDDIPKGPNFDLRVAHQHDNNGLNSARFMNVLVSGLSLAQMFSLEPLALVQRAGRRVPEHTRQRETKAILQAGMTCN